MTNKSVRKSGRIAKKSLRRFKNTPSDPIILELDEKMKPILKQKSKQNSEEKGLDVERVDKKRKRKDKERESYLDIPVISTVSDKKKKERTYNVTPLDVWDNSVRRWRERYPGRFIAPTEIVLNIVNVAPYYNGGMLQAREIDCKVGWKRCDPGSPYAGPLTILALLYVESIDCKGMKGDGTIKALRFWNKKNLKIRERLEIKGGGFGRGELKRLKSVLHKKVHDKDIDIERQHVEPKKMFSLVLENKKILETKIEELYKKKPENEEVLSLVARYNSSLKSIYTGEIVEVDNKIMSDLEGLKVNEKDCSGDGKNEGEISENENDRSLRMIVKFKNVPYKFLACKDNSDTGEDIEDAGLVRTVKDSSDTVYNEGLDAVGDELVGLRNDKPDDEDKVEEGTKEDNNVKCLAENTTLGKVIAKLEEKRMKPCREKVVASINKSPFLVRVVEISKLLTKYNPRESKGKGKMVETMDNDEWRRRISNSGNSKPPDLKTIDMVGFMKNLNVDSAQMGTERRPT
ncbi:hypothetical protein L1987_03606 [Smallanthus sonchifolius]|uniref:Uncharacterized protein n=1 Tax=Smallanthus sonchifolius TaxID=185202 RepID=A0ACB9KB68_9ASTR|nr:hypothetical protein L1987_03606 [Smallanthus sonchifolius]